MDICFRSPSLPKIGEKSIRNTWKHSIHKRVWNGTNTKFSPV